MMVDGSKILCQLLMGMVDRNAGLAMKDDELVGIGNQGLLENRSHAKL